MRMPYRTAVPHQESATLRHGCQSCSGCCRTTTQQLLHSIPSHRRRCVLSQSIAFCFPNNFPTLFKRRQMSWNIPGVTP